jgi:nucleoside-diphosphate-sugar epimerase
MVYGPGYSFSGAIGQALQDLVEKPLRGEPAGLDRIAASRQTVSALLYARDAADGAVRATLADDLTGWVFNVNAYSAHPLAEIAAAIGQLIPGARLDVPPAPTAGGPLEPDARAREQLGYVPRHNLVDGFGEYVEFLQTARLRDWKVPVAS